MSRCPCGSGLPYADCCGQYHRGDASAPTAEALMRSRFSAFAGRDEAYLLRTWDPATRPKRLDLSGEIRWVRLEVLETTGGGLFDSTGAVRFAAHFAEAGKPGVLRENSRFSRASGQWLYLGPVQ